MQTSIKVLGLNKVMNMLKKTAKEIDKEASKGIKEATLLLKKEVVLSIAGRKTEYPSVDTGLFKDTVGYRHNWYTGQVFSDLKYAPSLEYGTSRMKPRRHFRNSLARNRGKIQKILQNNINKGVRLGATTKL